MTAYQQWFRDTLRISSPKVKVSTAVTPSRGKRMGGLTSMETPSTLYTSQKQTPLTVRGSKGNFAHFQNKTIGEDSAGHILKNGIMVLGESPMKTIAIDLKPPRDSKITDPRLSECSTRYQQMLAQSVSSPRKSLDGTSNRSP